MSRRFRSSRSGSRGFTLMEAMVSLAVLVIVMVLTLTLVFSMRAFAERLNTRLVPRQTTRQAINYLSFHVQGAADLNYVQNNPNALVMWRTGSSSGSLVRVSYNNLTTAQSSYGDAGTDIITLGVITNPVSISVVSWPGLAGAAALDLNYTAGCSSGDSANLAAFKEATGFDGTTSPILTLVDSAGNWIYYQITSAASSCAAAGGTNRTIQVAMAGASVTIPTGHVELVAPVSLMAGVRYVSFRVRDGNLQQKQGFFDPATDAPGTAFSSIVADVEDLQVAYVYGAAPDSANPNVYIYNTATNAIPDPIGGVATGGVPPQAGLLSSATPTAWDIANVLGLRVSITSRSEARFTTRQISERVAETLNNFRPAVEDRTKGTVDGFDHYRVTTTLMIRNRTPGY